MAKRQSRSVTKKTKASDSPKSFVTSLALQVLRVTESHCVLSLLALEPLSQITVGVNCSHGVAQREHDFAIAVVTTVEISASPINPDNKSSLKITAKAECVYASPCEPPQTEFQQILMMGMMAAWPTLRETTCSLSMRTGQPPIVLPILYIDPATHAVSFLMGNQTKPIDVGQIVE